MTPQQEGYSRIEQMTDDGIRMLIDMIDKMKTVSITGFKDNEKSASMTQIETKSDRAEKKERFLQSAGKIQVDANAINDLRNRSMI